MKGTTSLFLVVLVALVAQPLAVESKSLVCYFQSWSAYRPGEGKFEVENIDPFLCTHVIFGFASLGADNTIVSANEGDEGLYKRLVALKEKNPALKVLLSIGGWNDGSEKYSKMAANPAERTKFVQSVVPFLRTYNFDGLDFDWEYPGTRGGDSSADKQNFVLLLQELKRALPTGSLLTAAVAPAQKTIETAYDIPALSKTLDLIHLMTYDYHGDWETVTGLHSPLYSNSKYDVDEESTLNSEWSVDYWLKNMADPTKLILGLPLYGRGFTLDDPTVNGIKAPASKPISPGPYNQMEGVWSYLEICEKQSLGGWTTVRDACYKTPYSYSGQQWIGYDDVSSLTLKTQYAVAKGLGGAVVWSIDQDDFKGKCGGGEFTLLNTIKRSLDGPGQIPAKC